ncbi:MAG: insulinase family protein [Micavibrio aeruginosavorus]|uniref:Insulinase family protein n=1 Tax=Micavibrio aeruginosavorus TaxID=349221 RepID=A0A7T5UI23_9BACT|nr:MAG: insulinase family protein [Micavibrio aeruginosavorus]
MTIEMTALPSGLRVITDTVKEVDSVALGVWVDVGTRHEDIKDNGVAHMVEHMMFKGTPTRTTTEIVEQLEEVGGNVNAYTGREVTAYHVHLLKEDMPLAIDIMADIIQHSHMPEEEIERERGVIIQEIGMNNDAPDELVFDYYQEIAYPGQTLGAPILGNPDIISAMKRDVMMDYVHRFYSPRRLVVSAAGHVDHESFANQVSALFTDLPPDISFEPKGADYQGGERREEKDLEQSHLLIGFQGISRGDPDIFAAVALATILGGGMSSRLFQEIREKRGLVYSIFTFHTSYQDDGQFAVYAGTSPEHLPELVPVTCDEILKFAGTVTEKELSRAKAQMKANLLMGRESMMGRANQQAKHLIHFGDVLDIQEKIGKIDALTTADVSRMAHKIFAGTPTVAALGPLSLLESYDEIRRRLRN